jgi:hypothetical protein
MQTALTLTTSYEAYFSKFHFIQWTFQAHCWLDAVRLSHATAANQSTNVKNSSQICPGLFRKQKRLDKKNKLNESLNRLENCTGGNSLW